MLLFCLGQPEIAAAACSPPPALFTVMRGHIYLLLCLCAKIYWANRSAAAALSAMRGDANTPLTHTHRYMLLFCRGTADKWTPKGSSHTLIFYSVNIFHHRVGFRKRNKIFKTQILKSDSCWDVLSLASCTAGRSLKEEQEEETISVSMQFKCSPLSTKN